MAVLGVELRASAREGGGQRPGVPDRHEAVALAVPEMDLAQDLAQVEAPCRAAGDVVLDHALHAAGRGGEEGPIAVC